MAETELQIPIIKGGATVTVNTKDLPDQVYQMVLVLGLKDLMNRGMTKVHTTMNRVKLAGEELAKAQAAAMEIAAKNLEGLKAGKLPRMAGVKASDDKVPGVVMTEARRLARNLIKDEIKAAGGKISHYEAKDITAAANAYLATDEGKALLTQAQANVEARSKAIEEKPVASLDALQSKLGIAVSAKKVEAAEKKKAGSKAAGDAVLSAAQAGKVKQRTQQPNK